MSDPVDAYKKLRKFITELSFEDSFKAAWAFSQERHVVGFSFPSDVERHPQLKNDPHSQPYPWQLEAIMQEVILHGGDVGRRGRSLKSWEVMAGVINALRQTEDVLHQHTLTPDNVMHEMLRIAHQQFPWQQRPNLRFISRYFQMFKEPRIDSLCVGLTGLSVPKVYAIGTALWAHYAKKPLLALPWVSTVPNIAQRDIESFFELYCADVYALCQRIKSTRPRIDETFGYDQRCIRATPLISFRKMGETLVACPLPTLLVWRFTSALYYDLTANKEFFNAFGASFQSYIGRVLNRATFGTHVRCLPEEKFGPRNRSKDTVDWVAVDEDAGAFIECKAKRLTLKSRTKLTDRDDILRDIDTLASYIVQLFETILDYQAGRYPSLPFDAGRAIYPVIVTPEDWFPLGTKFWKDLDGRVRARLLASGLSPALVDEMPYVLASSDELERAAKIVAKVGVRRFFQEYRRDDYSGWMLDRYMSKAFTKEYAGARDLFGETFDEILEPLTELSDPKK